MMNNSQDWRDILGASLSDEDRTQLAEEAAAAATSAPEEPQQHGALEVIVERKGRAGKTATIVCGFTISDSQLKETATKLQRQLGCGGSARSGEILLQGDRREAATRLLRTLGFKVK